MPLAEAIRNFPAGAVGALGALAEYARLAVLAAVGLLAFGWHLDLSLLEGTEGLYAGITRELVRSGSYLELTYQGEPYVNKPPLFFWILALLTSLFGDTEVALRLPGALCSLGTMALTYVLGRQLFSKTAAFWAAVVVASSEVMLWYGPRVLIDSTITFLITLALLAWAQASLRGRSPAWYLLSFFAMALGAMVKELHGFALPALVMVTYAAVRRDGRMFREPFFWGGLLASVALMGGYFWLIGSAFSQHFHPGEIVKSVVPGGTLETLLKSRPLYGYLGIMWFSFLPWCALIPPALLTLFTGGSLRERPAELFVLLWVAGFFIVMSLAQVKREPYLMPIVPGLGLLLGPYCQAVLSSTNRPPGGLLLRFMLGLLAVGCGAALFVGRQLIQRKWFVPADVFPPWFVLAVLACCAWLLYAVARSRLRAAVLAVGALGACFVAAVVLIILPAIDRASSPRRAAAEIKALAANGGEPVFLYAPGWPNNEDAIYYLKSEPALPAVEEASALAEMAGRTGAVTIVTDRPSFEKLSQQGGMAVRLLRELQQPGNKNLLLVSIELPRT
jgi:4-amino-4-deoxy-L-arabinose transferase-like glycosyltransferase